MSLKYKFPFLREEEDDDDNETIDEDSLFGGRKRRRQRGGRIMNGQTYGVTTDDNENELKTLVNVPPKAPPMSTTNPTNPTLVSTIGTYKINAGIVLYHVSKQASFFDPNYVTLSPKVSGIQNKLGIFSTSLNDSLAYLGNCANWPANKNTSGWIHKFVVTEDIPNIRMLTQYQFKFQTNPGNQANLNKIEKEICSGDVEDVQYHTNLIGIGFQGTDIQGRPRTEFALCIKKMRRSLDYQGTYQCRLDGLTEYNFTTPSNIPSPSDNPVS
jgi:hypothetical protein